MTKTILVKNIHNTEILKCKCNNWLDHWMKFTHKRTIPNCSRFNCSKKAIVGGHVKLCDGKNSNWYIIPLCSQHNLWHYTDCYRINTIVVFVSANVSKTCKK